MKAMRLGRGLLGSIFLGLFTVATSSADAVTPSAAPQRHGLWAHDNLYAWCVVPYDARRRSPEERAQMLRRLGFKHFAYDWRDENISSFDAEIEALKKNGVNLLAWWFPLEADNPLAKTTLETFKRHGVRPQLWVSFGPVNAPKTKEAWAKYFPPNFPIPTTAEEFQKLSPAQLKELQAAHARFAERDEPKTKQDQALRVSQEAERIHALVKLAAPYGSQVVLYNHNGWFGMMENQVAIIERLKELGVDDVGIAYNFSHARDERHDDTVKFAEIWPKIQPYVVAVNITGAAWEGDYIYPSQGDRELEMMRIIQNSGWKGRIGLIAEKGGDAQVTLKNYMIGIDWLAAELQQPGSGGARPFPLAPQRE